MNKIAAVIVTYNRKDYLINCLTVIRRQTLSPDIIYIVDNHSTSDTADILLEKKIITVTPDLNTSEDVVIDSQINSLNNSSHPILIKYIYKSENTGGAGGFYTGMKMAYDDDNEWLWMMDDDGLPAEDSLEQLFLNSIKYNIDFANALVINIEDRVSLSFGELLKGKKNIADYKDTEIIYNAVNPFNGTFINRRIPENIGFIKKEMFIWGDETEYLQRTIKNKFTVATIVQSIHYHPKIKGDTVRLFPFIERWVIFIKPEKNSLIYYRNLGYINYVYNSKFRFYMTLVKYSIYFLSRLKFLSYSNFIAAYINGSRNRF